MKRPHIILRKVVSSRRGNTRAAGDPDQPASNLAVEIDDIDEKRRYEIDRLDETEASAPLVPMRLITPIGFEAIRAGTPPVNPPTGNAAWGVEAVRAHTSPFTGAGVVVAVLDTGIDRTHPAFNGMSLNVKDFTGGNGGQDRNGHGTHCAGTIFGKNVNGYRIGVAPGVTQALIGKVLNDGGQGNSAQLVEGVEWAVREGATIISMSIGIDFPGLVSDLIENKKLPSDIAASQALVDFRATIRLFDALAAFIGAQIVLRRNPLLLAATGNECRRDVDPDYVVSAGPPAAADGFISVGALEKTPDGLDVAPFSNNNPTVSAPGVNIMSARAGGGLVALDGTSMATPHVAGVAALWAEQRRGLRTARPVKELLVNSATLQPINPGATPDEVGAGIVQAPQR